MLSKVLVANRGEIAVRAFRAAYELGLSTVAVFPFGDRNSVHRLKADESYQIGEVGHPVRSYLSVDLRRRRRLRARDRLRQRRHRGVPAGRGRSESGITAPVSRSVERLAVRPVQQVEGGDLLVVVAEPSPPAGAPA